MKLTNLRNLGRYINPETKCPVNVHKGQKKGYSVEVLFYLYRGKRQFISDRDFYDKWVKEIV